MNQSVYKRDFRDPRDIARLWKFLLNENLKSKFEYKEENGRARGMVEELSIKQHRDEDGSELSNNCIRKTHSNMNVINNQQDLRKATKAKSTMFLPLKEKEASKIFFIRVSFFMILAFYLDSKKCTS